MQIDISTAIYGIIIVFFAGFIQGMTAFGFILVALPLLSLFMSIKTVVPILVIVGIFLGLQLVWSERRYISIKRIILLIIFGIIGTIAGTYMLIIIDSTILKLTAGILIIITTIILAAGLRIKITNGKLAHAIIGLISGVLQGSISLAGPPVILFYANQHDDKKEIRPDLSIYFLIIGFFTMLFQLFGGITTGNSLKYALIFIPSGIIGNYFGIKISVKITNIAFKKIVLLLVGISGLSCILIP